MAFLKIVTLATLALGALAAPVEVEKRATYSGDATYYSQGGAAGSCGKVHSDSDKIVALSHAFPGGVAAQCGKTVSIHYKGKTTQATVADTCEGCSADSIDLSIGTMQQVDSNYLQDGRIQVTWDLN